MPTFPAIAFDRLIEPGTPTSNSKDPAVANLEKQQSLATEKRNHRAYVSPALYATPKPTPLPDSPTSFIPSPYIINHKRRGPRLLKSFSRNDVVDSQQLSGKEKVHEDGMNTVADASSAVVVSSSNPSAQANVNGFEDSKPHDDALGDGSVGVNVSTKSLLLDPEREGEGEDFFDPNDSVGVDTEMEDNIGTERAWKPNTPLGEYFDAYEELSFEGTPQSARRNVEEELRDMRLNLLMEIERRKQVEEGLNKIQEQWQRIVRQLSQVGLTIPEASAIVAEKDGLPEVDPAEELCQQVVLARAVANAIGRGVAKAEVELEMESHIESKNFEITRLCDRLHYYEAVNHEMSQRNQQAVERARQERHKRKRRQMWIWSSIGVAITLGSAALAWSYLPNTRGSPASAHVPGANHVATHKQTV